ncbi:MAG: rod shape-determining protein [Candidatus Nealsonbacteria bacterium CG_4_9_14_0_2_um_filter_37_38]|uniref:Cell shape-determining protein MreB n=1 Tax=Candidatus Nealsonbacteria bacterium CG_4_10_14_0_8_um_filter_37_14 TaxID=1974684 RepID=A0A2M7R710_9BACT|nr:MAG: rod shape-determining protein [Candidatus Nealsonbacteria bacterium CG11_big_fil_rev_8_21_14_0_20_37_68]PIW92098.1 MAG: rod shape-determining protein [Candidatus Nealsonbacteria bacterium CG_4_8_14_3_um_filter_37_23]PIY88758.1 MAG: rod shape-determining protein [Candidatus Nealsonbacteria bacterium CG_4_10_14_0_8_um_filter_37_14]PJC51843.1 MAG: rod shape-determining protein [Candidatus Nealsonbacteria bacterium CG_4_9_14_0_2_um_filter_37_38]
MFIKKIGIDLGTCNSVVFVPKKGIVLQEPSVVAVSLDENKILAVGEEAKEMIGRTPDTIRIYRPLRDGVIADFRVTQAMISYFLKKIISPFQFFKPELMISIPAGITSTEKRAVIEAGLGAGAKQVFVAKEPILAAIGAGIPINSCSGNLIVDIGGGTSEVAVISLGGIVTSGSLRMAGDKMDTAISDFIKKKHNLAVGEKTAEEIKIKIGTAISEREPKILEIRGRDLISGLPRNIKISSNEICEAISEVLQEIIQVIRQVLRTTPAELSADIMDKGIVLSGGGALLKNIDKLIAKSTGVPCYVAEEPMFCVAKGTGVVLENLELYKKSIMSKK